MLLACLLCILIATAKRAAVGRQHIQRDGHLSVRSLYVCMPRCSTACSAAHLHPLLLSVHLCVLHAHS